MERTLSNEKTKSRLLIALAGNPNSGKTTLFNALTGAHHHVGNYPGVTVEKREGERRRGQTSYHFVDLPGIYSLTAYSEDEVVSRDFLLEEKPDLIVNVLDSTNLERNLYLCLQMRELGIPVVGALNMSDEAENRGIRIDENELSATLGIPFVKITAQHGRGLESLLDSIDGAAQNPAELPARPLSYGDEIEDKLRPLTEKLSLLTGGANGAKSAGGSEARWLSVKLLEKDKDALERLRVLCREQPSPLDAQSVEAQAQAAISWIENHFAKDSEIVISEQRYGYIHGAVASAVKVIKQPDFSLTQAVDKVLMNRFLALPVFFGVLWAVFQLTFTIGAYPQAWLESFFSFASGAASSLLPDGLLRSLVVDGIIGGVGGVFSFVPLIIILFFFLSILEDFGYMARAAFATDKFLHTFGLHGQSVFPLMLGFGCSVPALMASRTLKSKRDRVITVLVTPMMSCGAKLPIHVLLAAAFFPDNAGTMVMLIYICGAALALASAFVLRRTVLRGDPTPFVMELPPYRLPTLRGVIWHVWEKTASYLTRAGTFIMAASVLVWAITTFPAYEMTEAERAGAGAAFELENAGADEEELAAYLETTERGLALEHSIAGRIGKAIEPVFAPLGFDWRLSVAAVTGAAAKEVVVSTLGVLYRVGAAEDEESESLREIIARDSGLNPLGAFVFMLFMLLIPPCMAALGTIKAEIGVKWLCFEVVFLFALGWLVSFLVYRIGSLV